MRMKVRRCPVGVWQGAEANMGEGSNLGTDILRICPVSQLEKKELD